MNTVNLPQHNLQQTPEVVLLGPVPQPLPLAQATLAAGFPSPATDYLEGHLDLNDYLIGHYKAATFLFTVKGASMQGAGILNGDKVIVNRALTAQHGHIVVAILDQEFTLKFLYQKNNRLELHPANPNFQPIVIGPHQELQIWGVVTGVVRRCSYPYSYPLATSTV